MPLTAKKNANLILPFIERRYAMLVNEKGYMIQNWTDLDRYNSPPYRNWDAAAIFEITSLAVLQYGQELSLLNAESKRVFSEKGDYRVGVAVYSNLIYTIRHTSKKQPQFITYTRKGQAIKTINLPVSFIPVSFSIVEKDINNRIKAGDIFVLGHQGMVFVISYDSKKIIDEIKLTNQHLLPKLTLTKLNTLIYMTIDNKISTYEYDLQTKTQKKISSHQINTTKSCPKELSRSFYMQKLEDNNFLVFDPCNHYVQESNVQKQIVWNLVWKRHLNPTRPDNFMQTFTRLDDY